MSNKEYGDLIEYLDQRFIAIDLRFDAIDGRLDKIESRLDGHDQLIDAVLKRLIIIEEELTILIHRVDRIEVWIKSAALKLGIPYAI